jgi:hypothetical protein
LTISFYFKHRDYQYSSQKSVTRMQLSKTD